MEGGRLCWVTATGQDLILLISLMFVIVLKESWVTAFVTHLQCKPVWQSLSLKPNTHRRRRRNSTVELSCVCVLNSQLVGDSLDESEQFADNEVELRRVGGVNAPVVSRYPVSSFLRQSYIRCRIVNWVTTADIGAYTPPTQLDSTRQDKF